MKGIRLFLKKCNTFVSDNLIIIVITCAGLLLRIFHLSKESLWVDEGFTYQLTKLSLIDYVENVLHTLRNVLPPLYFTLLHYWTAVFGCSEFSLRFPSVMFGVASIILSYKVGARLFDKRTGLFTAAIISVSLFHLTYSQEARMYEMCNFLALLSYFYFIDYLEKGGRKNLLFLTLANILLVYTHHYGFFIIVSQSLFLMVRKPEYILQKEWLCSLVAFIGVISPWLYILINQMKKVSHDPWLPLPHINSIYNLFVTFSGSNAMLVLFFVIIIIIIIADGAVKNKKVSDKIILLASWLIIPILLSITYSYAVSPVFGEKYLIYSSIPLYILGAYGMNLLRNGIKILAATAVLIFSFINTYRYFHSTQKDQWRETTYAIEKNAQKNELVLFNAGFGLRNGFDYYAKRTDLQKCPFPKRTEEINNSVSQSDLIELRDLVGNEKRIWLVCHHSGDKRNIIFNALSAGYTHVSNMKFKGINVYLFYN